MTDAMIALIAMILAAFVIITILIRRKRRWKLAGKLGIFSFSVEADDN